MTTTNSKLTFTATRLRLAVPFTLAALILGACGDANESTTANEAGPANATAAKPAGDGAKATPDPMQPSVVMAGDPALSTIAEIGDRKRELPEAPSGLMSAADAAAAAARKRTTSNEVETLSISYEPLALQLGMMQPGVPKTGTITMTNNGEEPVQIRKAIASCGCTTPNWPRDPIAPGESAEIEITLKPGMKQGQKLSKRVTLQMVDGPPQVLKVEGEVGLFVRISPTTLDASKAAEGPATITLDSADDIPFAIVSVDPAVATQSESAKGLSHELTVDWEKWESMGRRPQVKIRTDHPNVPEMSVIVRRQIKPNPRPVPGGPDLPTRTTSQIATAAQQNNLAALKAAIQSGDDVNDNTGLGGFSALHWAAKNGNSEIAMALIEAEADINSTNKVGKTPLTIAAESCNIDVLKMLVENGGNIEAVDEIGGTPLLWTAALCKDSTDTLQFLIESGANVDVVDTNGMTSLHWAAGIGQPAAVKLLIDSGAKLDVPESISQETALMRAARTGKPEALQYLVEAGSDLKAKSGRGLDAAMIAAESAPLEKVKILVEAGSDLSAKDIRGWTVIDYAKTRTDPNRAAVLAYLEKAAGGS